MARAKGLPFVVQPRLKPILERIGTEESGIIEIERRGYLSVAEKAIAQQATQGDESIRAMYSLGTRIAKESKRKQQEVMVDLMSEKRPKYMEKWEDEILERLVEMMAYQERTNVVQATALLICRVDENWTVDQSMDLHPDLVSGLARLYAEEDQKSTEALEAAAEQTEASVEGKQ